MGQLWPRNRARKEKLFFLYKAKILVQNWAKRMFNKSQKIQGKKTRGKKQAQPKWQSRGLVNSSRKKRGLNLRDKRKRRQTHLKGPGCRLGKKKKLMRGAKKPGINKTKSYCWNVSVRQRWSGAGGNTKIKHERREQVKRTLKQLLEGQFPKTRHTLWNIAPSKTGTYYNVENLMRLCGSLSNLNVVQQWN